MSRIQKEREREKRKKRGRKRDDKPTLLGHFKVPLPVFPAMLYFSSPSGWSTILKA